MPNKTARKGVYTNVIPKQAWLSDSFGVELALKKLSLTSEELESIVGRYTRGQRKGQLRGKIVWFKVEAGGWVHGIGVIGPCSFGYAIADYDGAFLYPKIHFPDTWSDMHIIRFFYQKERREKNQSNLNAALRERNITIQNPEILYKYVALNGVGFSRDSYDVYIDEILAEDKLVTTQKMWGDCDKVASEITRKLFLLGVHRDTTILNEEFAILLQKWSDMKSRLTTKKEEVDDLLKELNLFAFKYQIK